MARHRAMLAMLGRPFLSLQRLAFLLAGEVSLNPELRVDLCGSALVQAKEDKKCIWKRLNQGASRL